MATTKVQVKHTSATGSNYTDNFYINKSIAEVENSSLIASQIDNAIRSVLDLSNNTYQDSNLVMEKSLNEIIAEQDIDG